MNPVLPWLAAVVALCILSRHQSRRLLERGLHADTTEAVLGIVVGLCALLGIIVGARS